MAILGFSRHGFGIFSGSGGAFSLGPEQNTFTGATKAAAETARDTYATANAAWLSAYNDTRDFYILLEITGADDVYQRRNSAGDAWEDATFILQGPRGSVGPEGPLPDASQVKTLYESNDDTNAFDDSEETKLGAVESGATADQTSQEVKVLYEQNVNTNEFNDAEKVKLDGIQVGSEQNHTPEEIRDELQSLVGEERLDSSAVKNLPQGDITSVTAGSGLIGGGASGGVVLDVQNPFTTTDESKLDGIEVGATSDQTSEEIRNSLQLLSGTDRLDANAIQNLPEAGGGGDITAVTAGTGLSGGGNTGSVTLEVENPFTDADEAKLDGIESSATSDQTAVEIRNELQSLSGDNRLDSSAINNLPSSGGDITSVVAGTGLSGGGTTGDVTLNVENPFTSAEETKLAGIETGATTDQSGAEIKVAYEANANTNAFNDVEKSKLAGIENSATRDQSASEIKVLYESNTNTNDFTDTEKNKLAGIETNATTDQSAVEIRNELQSLTGSNRLDASAVQNLPVGGGGGDITEVIAGSGLIGGGSIGAVTLNVENPFTSAEETKLSNIETNATSDQSASEIKTLYESNIDTNALTDSLLTKLQGIEAGAQVNEVTQAELDVVFNGAVLNGSVLTLSRVSGSNPVAITLPSSGSGVSDGVVNSASVDVSSQTITLGTSTGGSVDIDLSTLLSQFLNQSQVDARVSAGVEDFAETGNSARVPISKLADGNANRLIGYDDSGNIGEREDLGVVNIALESDHWAFDRRVSGFNIQYNDIRNRIVPLVFDEAVINNNTLTLTRINGTVVNLTLPSGSGGVADGVISSATLDTSTKIVTLTTDQNDQVMLNLSSLALLSEVNGAFVAAGFSNSSLELSLTSIDGNIATLPLSILREYQGHNVTNLTTFGRGDYTSVDNNYYMCFGASVTLSNPMTDVPTHANFFRINNPSDLEIKEGYERNTNTNAFTDAEQSKLTGIESNAASVATVLSSILAGSNVIVDTSIAGQITISSTGGSGGGLTSDQVNTLINSAGHLVASQNLSDVSNAATSLTNLGGLNQTQIDARAVARYTDAEKNKLSGIETSATTDQTSSEIRDSLQTLSDVSRLDASAIQNLPSGTSGGGELIGIGASTSWNVVTVANWAAAPTVNLNFSGVGDDFLGFEFTDLAGSPFAPILPVRRSRLEGLTNGVAGAVRSVGSFLVFENVGPQGREVYIGRDSNENLLIGATHTGNVTLRLSRITNFPASGSGGDITEVIAGTGLSGGGDSGDVTLNVETPFTQTEKTKLSGIEPGATSDQLASEIRDSLQALSGASRLDASAIQNLPVGGGGGDISAVIAGTGLSGGGTSGDVTLTIENPFTNTDETKLDGIAAGAEVNVQSDWSASTGDSLILNKPTIPSPVAAQDEGVQLVGQVQTFNFVGSGVTATESSGVVTVTVEGGGTTPPVSSHTRYSAVSEDSTFIGSEFTDANTGSSSTTNTLVLPAFTSNRYLAFAIPANQPDLTRIEQVGSGFNQISAFTKLDAAISIAGSNHNVWVHTNASGTPSVVYPVNSETSWSIS